MSLAWIRLIFLATGLYDLGLGLAFLLFGPRIFEWAQVPPPNHWGYVQFGSAMLITFGLMFLAVAARPHGNRNLIPFGMLLKLSYVGIVGYYWVTIDLPWMFKPFAVADAIMLLLFILAYAALKSAANVTNPP